VTTLTGIVVSVLATVLLGGKIASNKSLGERTEQLISLSLVSCLRDTSAKSVTGHHLVQSVRSAIQLPVGGDPSGDRLQTSLH